MTGQHFTITHNVVVDLELCSPNTPSANVFIKHWNDVLGVWVKVREGSVIDFSRSKIGHHLFLKAGHVTQYTGFQELLDVVAPKSTPHLHNNLRGAWDSVHIPKLNKSTDAMFGNSSRNSPRPPHTPLLLPTQTKYPATQYASQALTDAIDLPSDDEPQLLTPAGQNPRTPLLLPT